MELAQETQASTRQHWSTALRAYIRNNRLTAAGLTLALLSVLILLGQSLARIAAGEAAPGLRNALLGGLAGLATTTLGALPALALRSIPQKLKSACSAWPPA